MGDVEAEWWFDPYCLAGAWLDAFIATGDDDVDIVMYRTIVLDVFSNGVRFTSTNGGFKLSTFAGFLDQTHVPVGDPVMGLVVQDLNRRGVGLFKFLHREAVAAMNDELDPEPVRLRLVRGGGGDQPALLESLERRVLVVDAGSESKSFDLLEVDPPDWSTVSSEAGSGPVVLSVGVARRLGGLRSVHGVVVDVGVGVARIRGAGETWLDGLVVQPRVEPDGFGEVSGTETPF